MGFTMTEVVIEIVAFRLEDVDVFGKKKFQIYIEKMLSLLNVFASDFWEDTDRGNQNIYYTLNKDQIIPFKKMLFKRMKDYRKKK